MNNNQHVLIFIKPLTHNDGKYGNPLAFDIAKFLYKQGLTFERVLAVNMTPAMLITHYDELMQEGREKIVYGMVGDYVSKELSEKLLRGEKLTEEEMNAPGKMVFVLDTVLPPEYTIDYVRKYIIGPTKILTMEGWMTKLGKDPKYAESPEQLKLDAMEMFITQYKTSRGIYQNLGEGACDSYNTDHCSDSPESAKREINNFFNTETFTKYALELNAGLFVGALDESVENDALFERKSPTKWTEVIDAVNLGYTNFIIPEDYEAEPYVIDSSSSEA
jgi:nucleoside diphosphate kinase